MSKAKKLYDEKSDMFMTEPITDGSAGRDYSIEHEPAPLDQGVMSSTVNPRENDNWAAMSTFCCETCMYYINFRCRRHSPAGQEGWSAVYNTDWCGDHKITKLKMALLKA